MAMTLTAEQKAILDGAQGDVKAKIMKTLVMYGETFGAEKMVPVTADKGHLVTSFGLSVMKPVYYLMDQLIEGGAIYQQPFSVAPKSVDKHVPSHILQNIYFKVRYSKQDYNDAKFKKPGIMSDDAYTST